jgi:hypothetical protein
VTWLPLLTFFLVLPLDVLIFSTVRASSISRVVSMTPVACWPYIMDELDYCKETDGVEFGDRSSS